MPQQLTQKQREKARGLIQAFTQQPQPSAVAPSLGGSKFELVEVQLPTGETIELEVPEGAGPQAVQRAMQQIGGGVDPRQSLELRRGAQGAQAPLALGDVTEDVLRFGETAVVEPIAATAGLIRKNIFPREGEANLLNRLAGPGPGLLQDVATGLVQAQVKQGGKAARSVRGLFQRPSVSGAVEAAGQSGAALLPVFGPAAAEAGEDIGAGDTAGGLGKAAGLIGSLFGPKVSARRAAGRAAKATATLPDRILKITQPVKRERAALQSSLPTAVAEVLKSNRPINSLQDLADAANVARKAAGGEIQAILTRNKAANINGKTLADAVRNSVDTFAEITGPSGAKATRRLADDLEQSFPQMTLEQAESFRQRINSEVGLFFRKNPQLQREALVNNPELAAKLALRDALETAIDGLLKNESLKGVRGRYGAARKLQDAVQSKILDEAIKENPSLLALDGTDLIAASTALSVGVFAGPEAASIVLGGAAARRLGTFANQKLRSPDARIKRAFAKAQRSGPSATAELMRVLIPTGQALQSDERPANEGGKLPRFTMLGRQ